jgi:hypothetical protein
VRDTSGAENPELFTQIGAGVRSQRLIVDVFYDDNPTFDDLPISDWTLSWDLESELKSTADLTAAYTSLAGESLSPREFLDTLAPYGQQVNVLIEVTAGDQSAALQLGRFRINQSPEAADSYFSFLGRNLTAGSLVKVTSDDLLSAVKRDGFHWPEPPILTSSTWDELQRISGLPVAPNLTDKATPSGLIYQPKEGGRLEAVQVLASWLGGVGVTNSFGELTTVPFAYGDPVTELFIGDQGNVLSATTSVDSDGLYNTVVGSYQEKDGTPIFSTYSSTGVLSPTAPFGEYTYYDSTDTVETQAQADARVRSVLKQLQRGQTYRVTLSCIADYRLEVGDVVRFTSPTGSIVGRMLTCKFTPDGLMETTIDVRRDLS